MITHARFATLRLAQFRPDAEIAQLDHWEFMNQIWVGEAVGFSEWLRLDNEPEILRSLAIDFGEFPEQAALKVLRTIDLPVRAAQTLEEIRDLLGAPLTEHFFAHDRASYDFVMTGPPRYDVSCTLLNEGGLTYLVVMVPLPKDA